MEMMMMIVVSMKMLQSPHAAQDNKTLDEVDSRNCAGTIHY
jgi:hypothetical protein